MISNFATAATVPPDRPVRRRRGLLVRLLLWAVALGLAVVLGLAGLAAWFWSQADMSNVGQLRFQSQLKVPPLLEPRVDGAGRKVFDLRLQAGTSELLAGKPTPTWGANGAYLGPTLRATRGDRVAVNVRNGLPEATTIHWHGMHLPAAADGGPHQPIQRAPLGRRAGGSTSPRPPCGTTPTPTSAPRTTSTVGWPGCSW